MEEEREEEQEEQPKKKKGKMLVLLVLVVVFLAAAAGGYFFFMKKGNTASRQTPEEETADKTVLVPFEPFILNLMEHGRFLKFSMQLELVSEKYREMVESKVPLIRDAIITLVSSKSVESLSSPEGKMQLKDEIILRANQAVGRDVIVGVYFTEFVMQ